MRSKASFPHAGGGPVGGRLARGTAIAAILAAAVLAGCAQRDSIIVGSVPDDYRTNHPIVVGERERTLDIPVAAAEYRLSGGQKSLLAGFMENYNRSSSAAVRILVPYGSANAAAASAVSAQMVDTLRSEGIPHERILIHAYDAGAPDVSAPIRVAYTAMTAGVGQCGRWPDDVLNITDNKHYANFGCAFQNNLAAQVADPNDLIGPRRRSAIDPENRAAAIEAYKRREITREFQSSSEIEY